MYGVDGATLIRFVASVSLSPSRLLYKSFTNQQIFFKFGSNVFIYKAMCRTHVVLVKVTLEGQGYWWMYESLSAIVLVTYRCIINCINKVRLYSGLMVPSICEGIK